MPKLAQRTRNKRLCGHDLIQKIKIGTNVYVGIGNVSERHWTGRKDENWGIEPSGAKRQQKKTRGSWVGHACPALLPKATVRETRHKTHTQTAPHKLGLLFQSRKSGSELPPQRVPKARAASRQREIGPRLAFGKQSLVHCSCPALGLTPRRWRDE